MSASLVLRLAGPLQAWGSSSQFNRRETDELPTKSGIVGLLAAAQGRRREDPIEDLLGLQLAVRIDQPGTLLRDFHTVSTLDGAPLLSATLSAKGQQKPVTSGKTTHVTHRFYLQDAVFVAAVGAADRTLLEALAHALRHPVFPLALGRRACVPTQPLLVREGTSDLWDGEPVAVIARVPWQASARVQRRATRTGGSRELAVTADRPALVPAGALTDSRVDVPSGFAPGQRHLRTREVIHVWVTPPSDHAPAGSGGTPPHDPFDLLGGEK